MIDYIKKTINVNQNTILTKNESEYSLRINIKWLGIKLVGLIITLC